MCGLLAKGGTGLPLPCPTRTESHKALSAFGIATSSGCWEVPTPASYVALQSKDIKTGEHRRGAVKK